MTPPPAPVGTAGSAESLVEQIRSLRNQGYTARQIRTLLPGVGVSRIIAEHNIPMRRTRPDLPGETWRPIPGWEGKYEVSDIGRVYSVWQPEFPRSGRIMRQQRASTGHQWVSLWRDGVKTSLGVHRLMLWAFVGPQPSGIQVRHLDGNAANNVLSNLKYGTPSENSFDRVRHGTDLNSVKTECPYGHPYDAENTYIQPSSGGRACRICKARRGREYEARLRSRRAA